jgi:protein involved in polysaccharide export with SLBB domain
VALRPYDQVFIKEIPDWLRRRTVTLRGEVRFPGEYEIRPRETLSSVLYRAGGFTSEAYLRGAVFVRQSAREVQQQRLNELRERLQQEIFRASAKEVQAALSKEDVEIQKHFLAAEEGLLKRLEQVQASGRVVIRLQPLPVFSGSEHDLALEDGDILTIPSTPNIVTVLGQVYNPTAIVHDEKHPELKHYLAKTGGPTANAEESQIYVVRADGTVVSKGQSFLSWSSESNRWEVGGSFYSTRLYPGDTVLVPEKIMVPSVMRDVKDISQILFQIAVTAGVLVVLF